MVRWGRSGPAATVDEGLLDLEQNEQRVLDLALVDHCLGEPAPLLTLDLHTVNEAALPHVLTFARTVLHAGRLDGYAVYFRALVDHDLSLGSSPLDPGRAPHWGFRILRTDRDDFLVGDTIEVRLTVGRWSEIDTWRWSHVKRASAKTDGAPASSLPS